MKRAWTHVIVFAGRLGQGREEQETDEPTGGTRQGILHREPPATAAEFQSGEQQLQRRPQQPVGQLACGRQRRRCRGRGRGWRCR